jgi:hypothetical protein
VHPTPAVKRSPNPPRLRRRAGAAVFVAALLLVGPALITPSVAATQPPVSLFPSTAGATITLANDSGAVEVGVRFQTSIAGTVTALRYYKPANSPAATKSGHLWSATGTLLASVSFTGGTASGWQRANLAQPVALAKNTTYTVSYFAPKGGYAATLDYFRGSAVVSGPLTASAQGNGVYRYGTAPGYPTTTYSRSPNYWADIVFVPDGTVTPPTSTTTAPTTTTKPPASTTTTSTSTTTTSTTTSTTTTSTTLPSSCATPNSPWGSLEACGWPGPANTGFNLSQCPGGVLTQNVGTATRMIPVTVDDTVISCQDIVGGLDIRAKRVVVKNSRVRFDGGGANGSSVITIEEGADATIDHVELNGSNHTHACVWHQGTAMASHALNCYGINDGIFSWADTGYSPTTGDSFTIDNSYFHDFTTNAANGHEDGYQTEGASHGVIRHNTYLMTTAADSAIAIWNSLKSSNDITVDNNLITGGGFSIYAEDYHPSVSSPAGGYSLTNINFTNNKFSRRAANCVGNFGVWFYRASWLPYYGGPTDGWHRSGNVVLETGENIDGGNPHVNGTLCS